MVHKWTSAGFNSKGLVKPQEGKDQLTSVNEWLRHLMRTRVSWWRCSTHRFIACLALSWCSVSVLLPTFEAVLIVVVPGCSQSRLRCVTYRPVVWELFPPDSDWHKPMSVICGCGLGECWPISSSGSVWHPTAVCHPATGVSDCLLGGGLCAGLVKRLARQQVRL